jgi:hypothetical protein
LGLNVSLFLKTNYINISVMKIYIYLFLFRILTIMGTFLKLKNIYKKKSKGAKWSKPELNPGHSPPHPHMLPVGLPNQACSISGI